MVSSALKFFVFKIISEILNFFSFSFLSNCYRAVLWTDPISFLVNYKIFCLVSVLSDSILTLLLSFSYILMDLYFGCNLMFVVFIWFCCRSWFAFLKLADRINLLRHFYSTDFFALKSIFLFIHQLYNCPWTVPCRSTTKTKLYLFVTPKHSPLNTLLWQTLFKILVPTFPYCLTILALRI